MTAPNDAKAWFMAVVRAVMGHVAYFGQYPARIVSQAADGSLELVPDDARLPGCTRVPIRYGVPGISAKVKPGSLVLLTFEGGDPRRPVATVWDTNVLRELRVTAETKVVLDCPSVELGGDGGQPIARLGDIVEVIFPTMAVLTGVVGVPPATQPLAGTVQITDSLVGIITSSASRAKAT